jgi:serine protease inhibitor
MTHRRPLLLALLALTLASCAKQSAERDSAPSTMVGSEAEETEAAAERSLDEGAEFAAKDESKAVPVATLVNGNNQFAIDLLKQSGSGPVAYSPYAVSLAGLMLQAGAEDTTRDQLRSALRISIDEDIVDSKVLTLREQLQNKAPRAFDPGVSAQLWVSDDLAVRGDWAQRVTSTFGLSIEAGDMSDPAATRRRIDDTVSAATVNLVQSITSDKKLDGATFAVTVAATPSGAWQVPFARARTKEAIFTNADGTKDRRPVMVGSGRFPYWEDGTMQVVGLPYDDNATAVIVLPRDGTFNDVEAALSHHKMNFVFGNMRNRLVDVTLPKVDIRSSLDIIPILKSMGATDAFGEAAAFGPALGPDTNPVALFMHETVFSIDEDGTRAQARTVQYDESSKGATHFEATRPFLVFVRDNATGQILTVARVI